MSDSAITNKDRSVSHFFRPSVFLSGRLSVTFVIHT